MYEFSGIDSQNFIKCPDIIFIECFLKALNFTGDKATLLPLLGFLTNQETFKKIS
jgi:hypothetical protein